MPSVNPQDVQWDKSSVQATQALPLQPWSYGPHFMQHCHAKTSFVVQVKDK